MTRRVTVLFAAPMIVLLAGCTPVGQFAGFGPAGGQPAPTASVSPTPTPSGTPEPTTGDCDDAVLNQPGEYHLPDCVRVTIDGDDIEVNAGDIETLVIRGDANDVNAGKVGSLQIAGAVNDVDTLDLGSLDLRGNFNEIGVHGSVERVAIVGDDNAVRADGDVGAVEDRGQRNIVGSLP